jgi:hypothetical protein
MSEQDLDTRIRNLVSRAVADAPPAPSIDPATSLESRRVRRDDHRRGWWVGGGAALLAAAAAITTLVLVADTDDRITTPADTTVPTVPSEPSVPVPSVAPSTTVPDRSAAAVVLTAGFDGVVEHRGETVRTLTTDAMNIALAAPDGRVVVQRFGGEGDVDEPLVLDPTDGSTTQLLDDPEYWDGLVRLHDIELVDGRQLLLYSVLGGTDRPDTDTERVFVVDLATAERIQLLDTGASVTDRLTMAPNGLVVGTLADDRGLSFLALAVPGSPAARQALPTAEQLGLQASYPGCDVDCPRMYTVAPDGETIAWIEGFEAAEIVVGTAGAPERIAVPFPPQGSGLDTAADGSFLLARSSPDVRAMRVARDGSARELEGVIVTAGPAGSLDQQPPAPPVEVTEPGLTAAAGPNGVALRTLGGDLARRLDQPATIALPVGDGRVVVQVDESVPSVWLRDGSVEDLALGASFPGPVTAQDVAIVDGRPLLLYVVAAPDGAELAVLDLGTAQTARIGDLPAALPPGGRLHLAANGLFTGQLEGGFFVTALPGSAGAALTGQLAEQNLGSDPGSVPLLTVSPDGSWIAWLDGTELVEVDVTTGGLGEERRWTLPFDTAGAVDDDVLAEGVIVDFGSGQDARYARRDGSFGVLEGPVATQGPGTVAAAGDPDPAPTTTTSSTTVPAGDPGGAMVTADVDGVAVLEDDVEVRRLDQPAEVAFLTPGGAVIFQPPRPDPGAEPGDPLIWQPDGPVERLLGELGPGQSYRVYDVADVAGVPTVLYGVRTRPADSDPAGHVEVLYALAMAPGGWTTDELAEINTWEAGFTGLSLSAGGLVVGTHSQSVSMALFTVAVPGSPAAGAVVPDAASLGLETTYGDCDCPGNYAISSDGGTIAWLDQGDVVVFDVETGGTQRLQHPQLSGFPVRLDIRSTGPDAYEVVIGQRSTTDATPIDAVRYLLAPAEGSELPLGTAFASFAP